jgi:hypothetical protein
MAPPALRLCSTAAREGLDRLGHDEWLASLRGAHRVRVVSCYFDEKWLNSLRQRLAKATRLDVHVQRPPSDSASMKTLGAFLKRAIRRGPTRVFLQRGQGLFHSKL